MSELVVAHRVYKPFAAALSQQARSFGSSASDITVRGYSLDELESLVLGPGGAEWDVALVLSDWLPRLIGEGRLLCLDECLADEPPEGWPVAWVEGLLALQRDEQGRVFGLPYHDGPEVLHYRGDLFDAPHHQEAFKAAYGYELRPPDRWSQFTDIAQFFSGIRPGLYGCIIAAAPDGHNNVYDFLIQLWSRGGELLDNGRAAFHSEPGVAGLQWLVELVRRGLTQPEPRRDDSVASGQLYADGRAAMMWNWSGYAALVGDDGNQANLASRVAPIPGGDAPTGRACTLSVYWVLVVNAAASRHRTCYRFISHATSPAMDKHTALAGATACRRETWSDGEVLGRFPYYSAFEAAHRHAHHLPKLVQWPDINEILSRAVDAAHGGADVMKVLREASEAVDSILERESRP